MSEHGERQSGHYKMKRLSELTGFSPTLLRAWERRYQFLDPDRMPGGHRLYTEQDYKVLRTVKELLDQGYSVGEAAAIGREGLLSSDSESRREADPAEEIRSAAEREQALKLAPTDLGVHRSSRYRGEGLDISLRELDNHDLATICRLYDVVKRTYELWLYMNDSSRDEQLIMNDLRELLNPELQSSIARLGSNSPPGCSPLLRSALDDARWGALGPLVSRLSSLPAHFTREQAVTLVTLSRDHAKILRNAFVDLDPTLRAADESSKAHGVRGMVGKFDDLVGDLETTLDWEGCVSSRCLETSTVDRVTYDFLRRIHALKPETVNLWVLPINDLLVRWVFKIGREGFVAPTPEQLPAIAVGQAVGVSPKAALEQGYLGARDGWAWFHWPIFTPGPGAAVCECEV